jgi:hypothetical protein
VIGVGEIGLAATDDRASDKHVVELWLHGRSEHTQRAYRADADRFLTFVAWPVGVQKSGLTWQHRIARRSAPAVSYSARLSGLGVGRGAFEFTYTSKSIVGVAIDPPVQVAWLVLPNRWNTQTMCLMPSR